MAPSQFANAEPTGASVCSKYNVVRSNRKPLCRCWRCPGSSCRRINLDTSCSHQLTIEICAHTQRLSSQCEYNIFFFRRPGHRHIIWCGANCVRMYVHRRLHHRRVNLSCDCSAQTSLCFCACGATHHFLQRPRAKAQFFLALGPCLPACESLDLLVCGHLLGLLS